MFANTKCFVLWYYWASIKNFWPQTNVLSSESMQIQIRKQWWDNCVVRIFDSFWDSAAVIISGKSVQTKSGHSTSHARLPPRWVGWEQKTKVTGHDSNRWRGFHLNRQHASQQQRNKFIQHLTSHLTQSNNVAKAVISQKFVKLQRRKWKVGWSDVLPCFTFYSHCQTASRTLRPLKSLNQKSTLDKSRGKSGGCLQCLHSAKGLWLWVFEVRISRDVMALVLSQLVVEKLAGMGCTLGCLRSTVTVEGRRSASIIPHWSLVQFVLSTSRRSTWVVRYKMMRQIAEGGFSTVDLVEDCETGKKYALKRILCHSIEDQNVALQVGLVCS